MIHNCPDLEEAIEAWARQGVWLGMGFTDDP